MTSVKQASRACPPVACARTIAAIGRTAPLLPPPARPDGYPQWQVRRILGTRQHEFAALFPGREQSPVRGHELATWLSGHLSRGL